MAIEDEQGVYHLDEAPGKPHPHCYCYLTAANIPTLEELETALVNGDFDTADQKFSEDPEFNTRMPKREMSKALPGLTKEQEDAVARYTANSFELNEKLRAGDDSDPMVKLLDDAIANSTLPRKTSVRRVITEDASYDALRAEKYGEAYSDPAFMSTQKKGHQSIEDLIEDFGVGRRRPIVLDIDLPKGYNALDIGGRLDDNPNSLGFDQGEVLLPRDAKFDITSYQNIGDYEILTLRPKKS